MVDFIVFGIDSVLYFIIVEKMILFDCEVFIIGVCDKVGNIVIYLLIEN